MTQYGPHQYGPVDDCLRCIWCEVLPGAKDPCTANVLTEPLKVERRDLVQEVLDQHFGIHYGSQGVTLCATCKNVGWPCPPALIAKQVRDEITPRINAMLEAMPKARKTDPETSHTAASLVKARAGTARIRLLVAFRDHAGRGITDEMAAEYAGLSLLSEYSTRCSELRAAGAIMFDGGTHASRSGIDRATSVITGVGNAVLARRAEIRK